MEQQTRGDQDMGQSQTCNPNTCASEISQWLFFQVPSQSIDASPLFPCPLEAEYILDQRTISAMGNIYGKNRLESSSLSQCQHRYLIPSKNLHILQSCKIFISSICFLLFFGFLSKAILEMEGNICKKIFNHVHVCGLAHFA